MNQPAYRAMRTSFDLALQRRPLLLPWLVFAALLLGFHHIYSDYFPLSGYLIGTDYSAFFPMLLEGVYWFHNNGWSIPWFSPAFCAGQPNFADPQAQFFTLPQLLTLLTNPLAAIYITLLLAATALYWGGVLLMRKVFVSDWFAAILTGGLLMVNEFLPIRIMVGHITFHAFALLPWVALLVLMPCRRKIDAVVASISAGLLMAYWVFSGLLVTMALPIAIILFALALIFWLRGGGGGDFIWRLALAGGVGIAIAAEKLAAVASFMHFFPRDFYALPGAENFALACLMVLGMLFLPIEWIWQWGSTHITNGGGPGPHEWGYGLGFASALLALVLIIQQRRQMSWQTISAQPVRRLLAWAALFLLLIVPVAVQTYSPDWHAFLKSLPLLRSSSTTIRWTQVYIPILAVVLGLGIQMWQSRHLKAATVMLCLGGALLQSAWQPMAQLKESVRYDIRPVMLAVEKMQQESAAPPPVSVLGTQAEITVGNYHSLLTSNDTIVAGMSQVYCYNPIFGYRLEKLQVHGLRPGDVLREDKSGHLNLANPACYLFPEENACHPGERFRADQRREVEAFITYRPWHFAIPLYQRIANNLALLALLTALAIVLAWLLWRLLRRHSI